MLSGVEHEKRFITSGPEFSRRMTLGQIQENNIRASPLIAVCQLLP